MQKSGFTIIEVLVASALVSVVCVGAFSLLSSGMRQGERAALDKEAVDLVQTIQNCLLSFGSGVVKSIPKDITGSLNLGPNLESCATGSYDTPLPITLKTFIGPTGSLGGSHEYKAYYITSSSGTGTSITTIVEGNNITRKGAITIY